MALPHLFISFYERSGFNNARVVYEHIRFAPKLLLCPREGSRDAFGIGDVTFIRQSLPAEPFKNVCGYPLDFLTRPCRDDDISTLARKCKRDRATNAATTTGNECESISELHMKLPQSHRVTEKLQSSFGNLDLLVKSETPKT
jgi:hypothetical protein